VLTACPAGVATEIRPEVPLAGTVALIVVGVTVLTVPSPTLNLTRLFAGAGSKFVPVMLTAVPAWPIEGVKPVIVGAPEELTVKGVLLVADPAGAVTAIDPVLAPTGTVVTICVGVEEVTTATVPLKVTVFWLGVEPKPVPDIVTAVPTGPLFGVNSMIETRAEL
jgi:hypothetical protein